MIDNEFTEPSYYETNQTSRTFTERPACLAINALKWIKQMR